MQLRNFYDQLRSRRTVDSAVRFGGIALAAVGLIICAPLVSGKQAEMVPQPASMATAELRRVDVKLRRGDTLLSVLTRFGLETPSAHAFIEKVRPFLNPRKIRAGHDVNVFLNPEGTTIQRVELVVNENVVRVKATADGWFAERREIPFLRQIRVVRGTISSSLYQSGIDAGLAPQQIMDLATIFEYEIDFFSDFQPRDAFAIAFEEIQYADGRSLRGRILAAQVEANGESYDAYYFVGKAEHGSYYDGGGQAVRRTFLRAPLSFARISSPYSTNRQHPIFRTVRPHRAIDYAAPMGTPVVTIGAGRVEFAGWRNGYGKVVDIRHSSGYMSRYAHFSRLAAGIHKGKSVGAGDVIGYVGQSGHATGPHLHFEFLRGAEKINFLALRMPKIERLAGDDLQRFDRLRENRQALLENREVNLVESHQGSNL